MIQKSQYTKSEWQERQEKILAALLRARDRAREIARQTGTPMVYMRDGKLVREYITDAAKTGDETSAT